MPDASKLDKLLRRSMVKSVDDMKVGDIYIYVRHLFKGGIQDHDIDIVVAKKEKYVWMFSVAAMNSDHQTKLRKLKLNINLTTCETLTVGYWSRL